MPMPDFLKWPDFPKCRSETIKIFSSSQKMHRAAESQRVCFLNKNRSRADNFFFGKVIKAYDIYLNDKNLHFRL